MARGANVPIVLGYLDYEKKHAGVGPVIYPSDDLQGDLDTIMDFYREIKGKHPQNGVR